MAEPATQIPASRFDFDKLFSTPQGEELPSDNIADDRTDTALQGRTESYGKADDLNWLLEGSEQGQPQDQPPGTLLGLAGAAAADVGKGAVEAPRQIIGGMRDAVQNIVDLGDVLENKLPLGGVTFSRDAPFIHYAPPAEYAAGKKSGSIVEPSLPEVGNPGTVTGGAARAISQFLTGFAFGGRMLGGVQGGSATATAARSMVAGGISDFGAFEGQTQRLANLIEAVPSLNNPITEYLAADPQDGEAEGRFKNALEGLALGGTTAALFRGVKALRSIRALGQDQNAAERIATAFRLADEERVLQQAGDMLLLGSAKPNAKLTVAAKARAATTETGAPASFTTEDMARALTTRGLTPLDGAQDVFVNFARIEAPDDIKRIINDTSSAFSESITKSQRGVRSNAQTLLSADDVDAWNTLLTRRVGQPLNAEQSVAARQLWATAGQKLGDVAQIAASAPTPENLFQFRRMLATFHAIQKEVIGARTETARALQSWRIPVGGNLEKMRDMTQALDSAGGIEESADLARRFAQLANMDSGKVAAMTNLAEKTFAQKALGSVQEYWVNSLLSGPKTHMVNVLSNSAVAGLSVAERALAGRFSQIFSDEAGVEIGEGLAMADGIRGGILDGFRNAGKALRTGQSGYGLGKIEMPRQRYISSGTWNVRSDSWLGRGVDGLGAVVNVPGKMLQAEDEFFKTIGYRMELHAQATRMVQQEIRSGTLDAVDAAKRRAEILADPPEAIRMEAVANAAYQTFTNDPGKLTRGIQRVLSAHPSLRFVLPFVNTPSNILQYTFERTPLAPVTRRYRSAIAEGGAKADLARTKLSLGTMSILFAIDLGLQGHITGSGPADNIAEMQAWRRMGNQPYSMRVGDKWIAFNRLDPLGYTLGMGADISEYLANSNFADDQTAADVQEAMAATIFSVAENVSSKSYLQGLSLVMEALNEPQRFASSYVEKFASSFIPTGVSQVAQAIDPVARQSDDIVSAMKRRVPGFSSDLPPRRDLWGREIRYESGLGRTYDAFSPLYGSQYKPEPIDELMMKDGWFVGMGGYSFTIDGERVSLKNRGDIKSRFYELRGNTKPSQMGPYAKAERLLDDYGDRTLLQVLNDVVLGKDDRSESFKELANPEDREDFVKDIVRDYYGAAKDVLFAEFPVLTEMAAQKKAARTQ